jgi:hypothetical protein
MRPTPLLILLVFAQGLQAVPDFERRGAALFETALLQGHLVKKDVRLGNFWQTMFGVMGVKVPENFQCGEADGIINEIM